MAVMDDIADELALKALDLEERTGDENAIKKLAEAIAQSSPTMEETFLTAVRIRRAERRARQVLDALNKDSNAIEDKSDEGPAKPTVSFDTD